MKRRSNYKGNPDGKPIYPNEMDHGYDTPIAGGTDVIKNLRETALKEQGNSHFVGKKGSRDYFDYQEKAKQFKVGDEVYFANDQASIVNSGQVVAVYPAIGTVDIQWATFLQSSVPIEDLRIKDKEKFDVKPPAPIDQQAVEKQAGLGSGSPRLEAVLSEIKDSYPVVTERQIKRLNYELVRIPRSKGFEVRYIDRQGFEFLMPDERTLFVPFRYADMVFEAFEGFASEGNWRLLQRVIDTKGEDISFEEEALEGGVSRYPEEDYSMSAFASQKRALAPAPVRYIQASYPNVPRRHVAALNSLLKGHGLKVAMAKGKMTVCSSEYCWDITGRDVISTLNQLAKDPAGLVGLLSQKR